MTRCSLCGGGGIKDGEKAGEGEVWFVVTAVVPVRELQHGRESSRDEMS